LTGFHPLRPHAWQVFTLAWTAPRHSRDRPLVTLSCGEAADRNSLADAHVSADGDAPVLVTAEIVPGQAEAALPSNSRAIESSAGPPGIFTPGADAPGKARPGERHP